MTYQEKFNSLMKDLHDLEQQIEKFLPNISEVQKDLELYTIWSELISGCNEVLVKFVEFQTEYHVDEMTARVEVVVNKIQTLLAKLQGLNVLSMTKR